MSPDFLVARVWELPPALRKRIKARSSTSCWFWTLKWNSGDGYSKCKWQAQTWMVHRLIYSLLEGPIPNAQLLDHKCRNRACCNPLHLEPVPPLENIRRGNAVLYRRPPSIKLRS